MSWPDQDIDKYMLFDEPLLLFAAMIEDIKSANKTIFLQTYKFANDAIGRKFRTELTKKAKQGVRVVLLIDSWGAGVNEKFFAEMISHGGEIKFFKKVKFSFDFFSANHRRNHCKMLIIDERTVYVGSSNITNYCINWRESILRLNSGISKKFKKVFFSDYNISNKFFQNKKYYSTPLRYKEFEIIKDVPSNRFQPTRDKFRKLINEANEEIIIETPYFLPGSSLRKAILDAAKRGVKIKVIIPLHSDVKMFDILRNKFLGMYYKNNIEIIQYKPNNLHAKLFVIDNKKFLLGSSNFDYRSFRFMHEINLYGENVDIVNLIIAHLKETESDSELFDYNKWKNRGLGTKIIEQLLFPIRHFF